MKKTLLTVSAFAVAVFAYAGGFRVSLQGIKQAAAGHTGVSSTRDASAIFFNPAGIVESDTQWSISANVFGVKVASSYLNTTTGEYSEIDSDFGTPFAAYVSSKLGDRLAVGLGVYTPYGSTLSWGNDWEGQYLVRNISMEAFFIQPTVAYKLSDWASLGVGMIYAIGGVTLNRGVQQAGNHMGNVEIKSDNADGIGFNAGLMLKPNEQVSIGLNYRSEVTMEAEGTAIVTYEGSNLTGITQGDILTQDGWTAELPMPAEITMGITYKPVEKLSLSFDLNYALWSAYKALAFDFTENNLPDASSDRNYENTFIYRAGIAYDINSFLTWRLGAYYDETPSPADYFSPETPTVDIISGTTGVSLNFKNGLSIDAAYVCSFGKERYVDNVETGFRGDVKTDSNVVGLGASFNF